MVGNSLEDVKREKVATPKSLTSPRQPAPDTKEEMTYLHRLVLNMGRLVLQKVVLEAADRYQKPSKMDPHQEEEQVVVVVAEKIVIVSS